MAFEDKEARMRGGCALGKIGPIGTAENLIKLGQRAAARGYDTLWSVERLLWPVNPQAAYPVTSDGMLPEEYKHVLDPLETMTFVAAHTKRIAVGSSVLDMPYYNPVTLARRLTTLDVLSGGRLRVGLGLGWSKDECEAAGAEFKERGARADEVCQGLTSISTSDTCECQGTI